MFIYVMKEKKKTTQVQYDNLNPKWDESFEFKSFDLAEHVIIKVLDKSYHSKNDMMGQIDYLPITKIGKDEKWFDLKKGKILIRFERPEKVTIEAKQAKFGDSNVEKIGSKEDIELRVKAAKTRKRMGWSRKK